MKLVVVCVSDDHAQDVENACSEIADRKDARIRDRELPGSLHPADDRPVRAESPGADAIAFGIIAPPPGGCATSYEVGWDYSEAVQATGGSYGSVCASVFA